LVTEKQTSDELSLEGSGVLQFREYLEAAKRRKWAIILPVLGIFIATLVAAYRLPNLYRAETVILVDPQQVPSSYVNSTVVGSISDRLSTIQEQVLSPSRLQKLVETTNLYAQAREHSSKEEIIKRMQNSISVDLANTGGSRVGAFRIAYTSPKADEAARMANALASMFIEENLRAREAQSEGTAEFLDSELQGTKEELEKKEKEVQEIKTRNVMDLPDSKQYHLEVLGNLRAQLQASQDRVNRAQQEKLYTQSLMMAAHPTVNLDSGSQDTGASPRQSEIQKLETRLAELQARYGPDHPDVRRTRKDLADLKKKDAADESKARPQPQVSAETLTADARKNPVLESQLSKLSQEIEEQTKLQAQLQQQIDFHASKLEQIPVFEQRIAGLMRDYDTLRAHYTSLLDKKLSAQMANALESHQKAERFVILDSALPPSKPFSPNRQLICLAGLFGGFLGGIGLAVLLEMSDETVRSETEATRITGKPVLAGIPQLISAQEKHRKQLHAVGAVLGTMLGSAALGLMIAKITSVFS